jgi:hypothetical protein
MECRLLPSLCDFVHVGFLCTFSKISAAAAVGFARSSQLNSSHAGQAVQYVMAQGYGPPITAQIIVPPPPLPSPAS